MTYAMDDGWSYYGLSRRLKVRVRALLNDARWILEINA
jgi:hypothetical protein